MIPYKIDTELFTNISLNKILMYLEYKGWKKQKEVEGIASVWSYIKKDKKISVLVPLDKEFADFEIKMEELVTVLAKVEERHKTEILKALENTSSIAKEKNREVIDIKIQFLEKNQHEVSAKEIGTVLTSLQDFFCSIESLKSETVRKRFEKNSRKSELELSLIDTFQGSFGIRVALPEHRQPDLFENLVAEQAAESFIALIQVSSNDNYEILRKEIEKLPDEPLVKFKILIKSFMELDSDLIIEWGSVNPEKGAITKLPLHKIVQAFEIVSKVELERIKLLIDPR
ncbi:hypothetical protein [Iningainema tapete]|uniref:Uncharacterized protein n=1 Tax=Iningainema tapete BLCC-T55 TaxID=2748662 RepID=A0A8J6XJJ9_9CYAN|nr:hypothetical protein [Iningainema tapete]MBD2772684.1 hypothetical protein [Iningainema tapete BLCC-T55]